MLLLRGVRLLIDRVLPYNLKTTGAQRPVVFFVITKMDLYIVEPIDPE
jgi:hypothetical protein